MRGIEPKPDPNKSGLQRAVAFVAHPTTSRGIENWLAGAGIVQAAFYGVAEGLARLGVHVGSKEPDTSFPWITVIIFVGCVLPKTVGRATSGKLLGAIASRFGGR